jgi:serine/threonine protein kinase
MLSPRAAEFHNIKKLGLGSFGVVYRVTRRSDGAEFALKEISLGKEGLVNVMKEVETMKMLQHRNIVRLYEHWMDSSQEEMYLLMELCSAGTLQQNFMYAKTSSRNQQL